jgi:hypothetical protein
LRFRRVLTILSAVVVATFTTGLVGGSPATAAINDGRVLPASSLNNGWTLERAISATSAWNSSPTRGTPPPTPFQILYVTGGGTASQVGNGTVVRNSKSFTVPAGKSFFVPVAFVDDTPAILGTFPTTHTQALSYWYGKGGLGTQYATIAVDGRQMPLSHDYLVGPMKARLSDNPPGQPVGSHLVEEAAFLSALPKGHHVIDVSFTWSGAFVKLAFGTNFYTFAARFPITVT